MFMQMDFCSDCTVMQERKRVRDDRVATGMKLLTLRRTPGGSKDSFIVELTTSNTITALTREYHQRSAILWWGTPSTQPKDQFTFLCASGEEKNPICGRKMLVTPGEPPWTLKTTGTLSSTTWKGKRDCQSTPSPVPGTILICWRLETEGWPMTSTKLTLRCGLCWNLPFW